MKVSGNFRTLIPNIMEKYTLLHIITYEYNTNEIP